MPLERDYQPKLIRKLKRLYPGAIVLKNDPNYLQGFPDIIILFHEKWAVLETKRKTNKSSRRPNQDYYIDLLRGMSYASFIDPETEERVLDELSQAFRLNW